MNAVVSGLPAAANDLSATLGFVRVVSLEPGRAAVEYACGMHMCHSGGVAQGGFVAGWIDAAMAHAVMAKFGHDPVPISLELKISYFAPANPGVVLATGWIEAGGKSTLFAEGTLHDAAGKLLAKGTSTVRMIPVARVSAMAGG
ncbi:thioesterase [alpha proteobacterium AAP81b]|nr:thioesterase [alpha proteobacterium AAP81b]